MKKTLFFLLFAAFSMTVWGAKGPGFGDRRYTLTAMGELNVKVFPRNSFGKAGASLSATAVPSATV